MAGSSNNSFIPKRKPSKLKRANPKNRLMFLTVVAYSLLFAALLAAGASIFYKSYTEGLLREEVVQLNDAVDTFSVADFRQVQEFDVTLKKADGRLNTTPSIASLLEELDRTIAQPIQIKDLSVVRERDSQLNLRISFLTETLDAALFQRQLLNDPSKVFEEITVDEVSLATVIEDEEESIREGKQVGFVANFVVPLPAVQFNPTEARRTDAGTNTGDVSMQRQTEVVVPTEFQNLQADEFDQDELDESLFEPTPTEDGFDTDFDLDDDNETTI